MNPWKPHAVVTFGLVLAAIQTATSAEAKECRRDTPLPAGIALIAPGPEVPDEIARFAAVWNGAEASDGLLGA